MPSLLTRALLFPVQVLAMLFLALCLALVCDLTLSQFPQFNEHLPPAAERVGVERELVLSQFLQGNAWVNLPKLVNPLTFRAKPSHLGNLLKHDTTNNAFTSNLHKGLETGLTRLKPTLEVFALRLLAVVHITPALLIFSLIGGLDGLVRRAVRKASAGLESARIYHLAKSSIKPALMWIVMTYLILPVAINPTFVYLTLALVLPVLVGLSCSRFKKYF